MTRSSLIFLVFLALAAPRADAVLSEPDFILFGTVAGTPPWQSAGSAAGLLLVVRDESSGTVLASAVVRDDGFYELRVPIDSVDPQAAGTSREGLDLDLFLDGVQLDAVDSPTPISVLPTGSRGSFRVLDINLDELIVGPNFRVVGDSVAEDVAGGILNVPIVLANNDGASQRVNWLTVADTATAANGDRCAPGADFVPTAGVAEFAPGDTMFFVPVRICNDSVAEGDEQFLLRIANPANQVSLADAEAIITISDDDAEPALSINDVAAREPSDGRAFAVFRVTLDAPRSDAVTVSYRTTDLSAIAGVDYAASSGEVVVPAGELEVRIEVEILSDRVVDDGEQFAVILFSPLGARLGDPEGIATIQDAESEGTLLADSGAGQATLEGPIDLAAHPSGRWLFVANETGASITRFDASAEDGTLSGERRWSAEQLGNSELTGLRQLEISPGGEWLIAVSESGNAVSLVAIDDEGLLTSAGRARQGGTDSRAIRFDGLTGVRAAAISPDGAHVYAVSPAQSSLAVLTREATQALLMTELEVDGRDDPLDTGGLISGMSTPVSVAAALDGRSVYVASPADDAILHFSRDDNADSALYGQLTFRRAYTAEDRSEPALAGVDQVIVSASGENLYAVSSATGGVVAFRLRINGELRLLGSTTVSEALSNASDLAVTGDGAFVLGTSPTPGSLVTMARRSRDTVPVVQETLVSGLEIANGLAGAAAVSSFVQRPRQVYVAAYDEDRVSLFTVSLRDAVFRDGFER